MSKIFIDTEFLEGTQKRRILGIPLWNTAPTIDLISIGLVDEDGREYYGISREFNLREAWNRFDYDRGSGDARNLPPRKVYWIRNNVLLPIYNWFVEKEEKENARANLFGTSITSGYGEAFSYSNLEGYLKLYGKSRSQIKYDIETFLCPGIVAVNDLLGALTWEDGYKDYLRKNPPHFHGYFSDYDWVVFCWIFGTMNEKPDPFPFYCRDMKQTMDEILEKLQWFHGRDIWSNTRKVGEDDLQEGDYLATLEEKVEKFQKHPLYPPQINEHSAIADARFQKQLYYFLEKVKSGEINPDYRYHINQ